MLLVLQYPPTSRWRRTVHVSKYTQLALPKAACDEVYATSGYESSVTKLVSNRLHLVAEEYVAGVLLLAALGQGGRLLAFCSVLLATGCSSTNTAASSGGEPYLVDSPITPVLEIQAEVAVDQNTGLMWAPGIPTHARAS